MPVLLFSQAQAATGGVGVGLTVTLVGLTVVVVCCGLLLFLIVLALVWGAGVGRRVPGDRAFAPDLPVYETACWLPSVFPSQALRLYRLQY